MLQNKWVKFVLFLVIVLITWEILEFLYSKIAGGTFAPFSLGNLLIPLVVGIVMGYFTCLRKK